MSSDLVELLLVSLVPSVALTIAGFILFRFRNFIVSGLVLLVGLVVAIYAAISLVTHSQELKLALRKGQVPILVIWGVIHFVIVLFIASRLIWRAL